MWITVTHNVQKNVDLLQMCNITLDTLVFVEDF